MSRFENYSSQGLEQVNQGLRSYMIRVYNYMALSLLLTGLVAYVVASTPVLIQSIAGTPLGLIFTFAPLGFVLVLTFGINKLKASTAQLIFWLFALVNGVTFSYILLAYTGTSVARVFLITSATFLTMSIYGYTTRADLTRFGSILIMALIGIVIAAVVNIFLKSSMLQFGISVIGVIVFTGLTAWDTQRIKLNYQYVAGDSEAMKKSSIYGALSLYLNFINLFIMLMNLIGQRR